MSRFYIRHCNRILVPEIVYKLVDYDGQDITANVLQAKCTGCQGLAYAVVKIGKDDQVVDFSCEIKKESRLKLVKAIKRGGVLINLKPKKNSKGGMLVGEYTDKTALPADNIGLRLYMKLMDNLPEPKKNKPSQVFGFEEVSKKRTKWIKELG